ncbi:MAG: hypothetical protein Q9228_005129 [Teloschistes exilis]
MKSKYPEWEDEVLANSQVNNRSARFLHDCKVAWNGCTEYFATLNLEYGQNFYGDLMAAHLKNAVNWWHQAWNHMREGTARDNYGLRNYIAEGMHLYWDYLDLVVDEMGKRGWMKVPREKIREAWMMMIFRGFCWWRSHWMMEGQDMCEAQARLPSQYYAEGRGTRNGDGEDGFVLVEDSKAVMDRCYSAPTIMAERVKEVAVGEVDRIKHLTTDAARSAAYLYPIRGIAYFLSHKALWKPLTSKLAPTMSLGLGITTFMFVFTYLPQAAVMAFTNGPLAAISAGLLVLSESSTLFTLLSKTFLIDDALIDTFDGVLLSKNTTDLVSEGRQIKSGNDPIAKLGKLAKKPFQNFTPTAIIRYLMYLPLNFIPVVGTVMFVLLQGKRSGPVAHTRYFQLKRWNKEQQEKHIEQYRGAYTGFGVAAVLLELVPLASIFFAFTNTVGAALWAADIEKEHITKEGTAPRLREQAKKAE